MGEWSEEWASGQPHCPSAPELGQLFGPLSQGSPPPRVLSETTEVGGHLSKSMKRGESGPSLSPPLTI